MEMLKGRYRGLDKLYVYKSSHAKPEDEVKVDFSEIEVQRAEMGKDGDEEGAIFGRNEKGCVLIYSPSRGLLAEKIVEGYNEKPRKPIKGQTGHQMMLISDMVMQWDPVFAKVLKEYSDDEEVLKKD